MQFLVRTKSLMEPDFAADERDRLLAAERERAQVLADGGQADRPLEGTARARDDHPLGGFGTRKSCTRSSARCLRPSGPSRWRQPLVQRNLRQHAGDPPAKVA